MPTFTMTTPIFNQRPRVLNHPSRLTVRSRQEIAQKRAMSKFAIKAFFSIVPYCSPIVP